MIGVEYQRERYGPALHAIAEADARVSVRYANAYELDFGALPWRTSGPLLVLGNPPWVTASALGKSAAATLQPPRSKSAGLAGLAARTGAANFDVAEFLLLKILRDLCGEPLSLAFLVKESVARKVLRSAVTLDRGVIAADIVRIDARKSFGVAVDACCLLLSTVPRGKLGRPVAIANNFCDPPLATFVPSAVPGPPARPIFRQGIKHDAADVFELRRRAGVWRNGFGERVDVEAEHIYPLRKAKALHAGAIEPTALIVTQRRLGASTDALETAAPRLWRYLHAHAERIAARKSSIYRNAPRFALFGIGPYSFALWKVAVAGLYVQPRFRLIGPQAGRPVLLGDTSYFAPFEHRDDARAFAALCTSPAVTALLHGQLVRGKRPVTKALLDAVDWPTIAAAEHGVPDRLRALLREPFSR